jgi:predicted transcriptional regulator
MPKVTVSFRTEESHVQQLDELAQSMRCDRTQLLQEAIDNYLWLQAKHRQQIEDGLRAAEAGDFATDEEVEAAFALWRES